MNTATINTRRFTKEFPSVRRQALEVYDREEWLGTWTPAPKQAVRVDFAKRAEADSQDMMPVSFAQILQEGKKR